MSRGQTTIMTPWEEAENTPEALGRFHGYIEIEKRLISMVHARGVRTREGQPVDPAEFCGLIMYDRSDEYWQMRFKLWFIDNCYRFHQRSVSRPVALKGRTLAALKAVSRGDHETFRRLMPKKEFVSLSKARRRVKGALRRARPAKKLPLPGEEGCDD